MADYDRRQSGGGNHGGGAGRKRRYRDDDEYDRRPPRRNRPDHAPLAVRVRRQLLNLAESPLRRWHDEVLALAHLVTDNWEDEPDGRRTFVDLSLQLVVEQPLKTPFVAAAVVMINTLRPELVDEMLGRVAPALQARIEAGEWRDAKLYIKFLACLQSCLSGDGVFPILEELFNRAVVLQTEDSVDTIGTELVKIILLTIPYIMAAAPGHGREKARALLEQTNIIASEPHPLQTLIDPFVPEKDASASASQSFVGLLQKQLMAESDKNWELACLPKPWLMPLEEIEAREKLDNAPKHDLPAIVVPDKVPAGPRPLFPEVYLSVYAQQDIESVPPNTDIAASLVRDGLLDTINILDFNRNISARYLIDLDCYFTEGTFVKRATPFDRLRDVEPGRSTWKPEDVAVDTVFSQLFQLPAPEHKLVYYHSVLTEACKIAPAAIAPSLGRAIRYLYRSSNRLDLELSYRFLDWFSHHLSNFGFTWKWTEWVDDVYLPDVHPCKAFIVGALDKEIRLSFASRIKGTLPEPLRELIGPEREQDVPDFKFNDETSPFAAEGKEIAALLRRKAPDEDFNPAVERIESAAGEMGLDPVGASTDVFMTAVCWVGSKSLSHVLACIERTKERLLHASSSSADPEVARSRIITAVMAYWQAHPGVAISIIEKLLNYSILTPLSVIQWSLASSASSSVVDANSSSPGASGDALAQPHIFEMVFNTVAKVTGRVRQVHAPNGPEDEDMKARERAAMRDLFRVMDDTLVSWAGGSKDEMMEEGDGSSEREALVRSWGARWLRVFRRRSALEEAFLREAMQLAAEEKQDENGA